MFTEMCSNSRAWQMVSAKADFREFRPTSSDFSSSSTCCIARAETLCSLISQRALARTSVTGYSKRCPRLLAYERAKRRPRGPLLLACIRLHIICGATVMPRGNGDLADQRALKTVEAITQLPHPPRRLARRGVGECDWTHHPLHAQMAICRDRIAVLPGIADL